MGRFEELVQQVRDGDTEALATLETEFSGSNLRSQAEEGAEWQKKYQETVPYVRQARVEDLVGKLDETLQSAGVTAEDFGDVEPDSLSLELIQDKARERVESRNVQRQAAAEDAGFDSVEEYESALETVKEKKAAKREGMEAIAGGVASGSGDSGDGSEPSNFDKGKEAFDAAKQEGRADDIAMASSLDAILGAQFVGDEAE